MDNQTAGVQEKVLWIDMPGADAVAQQKTQREDLLFHFREFREKGYTVVRGALPPSVCDAAKRSFFEWCEQHPEESDRALRADGFHRRLINFHMTSNEAAKLFTTRGPALEVLDFLFGHRASVYTTLYFERGTEQPIHIDLPVFFTEPENFYFGVWFALEDADEDNGALKVVTGGHKLDLPDRDRIARDHVEDLLTIKPDGNGLWVPYQNAIQENVRLAGLAKDSVPVKKGDIIIWHPLLPHGGGAVKDVQRSRHSMVFHVVPEGVPVYQADVFFNAAAPRPSVPRWQYNTIDSRNFAKMNAPSFGDN